MMVMTTFKPKTSENFEEVLASVSLLTFQEKRSWFKFRFLKVWLNKCQFWFQKFSLKPGFRFRFKFGFPPLTVQVGFSKPPNLLQKVLDV